MNNNNEKWFVCRSLNSWQLTNPDEGIFIDELSYEVANSLCDRLNTFNHFNSSPKTSIVVKQENDYGIIVEPSQGDLPLHLIQGSNYISVEQTSIPHLINALKALSI